MIYEFNLFESNIEDLRIGHFLIKLFIEKLIRFFSTFNYNLCVWQKQSILKLLYN